ncbi:hypothetical protein GJAV_G00025280 [Gymnothorax javanicus]|nr:hypothetical protein GJAV_G00025280 [Gymnothorax javanicus]
MDLQNKGHSNLEARSVLSSGSSLQARRASLEKKLSGGVDFSAPNLKTSFVKSNMDGTGPTEWSGEPCFPKPKALVSRFEQTNQDQNSPFTKQLNRRQPLEPSQDNKPATKLPQSFAKHPSLKDHTWRVDSQGDDAPAPPRIPLHPKQKSSNMVLQSRGGAKDFRGVKPHPSIGLTFSAGKIGMEENNSPLNNSHPPPPQLPPTPKPFAAKTFGFLNRPSGSRLEKDGNGDPSAPKRNPLPSEFDLGFPPPKPNRPPNVHLEKFKERAESVNSGIKHGFPPSFPAAHPGNHVTPSSPSNLPAPPPPNRSAEDVVQPDMDDNYDDIGMLNLPPPLPAGMHPMEKTEGIDSEEESQDVEEKWPSTEPKEKAKKLTKEEKKRLEQEKKEQKEREKKELEIRKRFKLSGPIQVIHKAKAWVDCKGGKNDLTVKQGEIIEIVRVLDNPGGRWLARRLDGSYGYVKIESVEIDYSTLKMQNQRRPLQATESSEVYDDAGADDSPSGHFPFGQAVATAKMLEEDPDIYDDVDDLSLRLPPPSPPLPPPPPDIEDDIYDDVDAEDLPPPPIISNLPQMKSKWKAEERDPKKQKKFEKEEKEFRKKFKYDGEIWVLYQVTIASTLATKKWGSKDLPLKPGETIDVIVESMDSKLIGRNQEGKIGYVSVSNIITEDADIYEDCAQDDTYDND